MPRNNHSATTTTTTNVANPAPRHSQRIANRQSSNQTSTTTTTTTTTTTSSSSSSTINPQQAIDRKEKKEKRTKKQAKSKKTSDNKENTNTNNTPSSPTSDQQVDPCGICFEAPEVKGKIDTCEHTFCFECINTWGKKENSCPLCKSRFHSITKIHLKQPTSGKRKRSSVVRVRNRNQQPVYQSIPWQNFGDDEDEESDSDFDFDQAEDEMSRHLIFDNFNLQNFHFQQFTSFSQFPNLDQDLDDLETELEVEGLDTEDFHSFRNFVHSLQILDHHQVHHEEELDEEEEEEEIDEDEDSDSEIREIEQIVIDDTPQPQARPRQPHTYNVERDEFGRELILIDDFEDNTVNNSRQTRIRRS